MHIGVNGRTFSVNEPRGSVLSSIQLTKALNRHKDTSVTVFGPEEIQTHFSKMIVQSDRFSGLSRSQAYGLLWEQSILPKVAKKSNIDILFCPNSDGLLRDISIPQVTKLHDLFGYLGNGPQLYQTLQRFRVPRMVDTTDRLVVPSSHTRDVIQQNIKTNTEIDVVHNGIADEFLQDHHGEPVSLPDKYLLYVGGTDPRKNIDNLLAAYEYYRAKYDDGYKLVMVGPNKRFIDGSATRVDASTKGVNILGFLNRSELKYVYTNADVFVFPSLDEGFGLPPLEAMACGTPVVSSDQPPMPEILGDAASYTRPTDPEAMAEDIREVISEPGRREVLSTLGRKKASEYTWDKVAEECVSVFQKVIERK